MRKFCRQIFLFFAAAIPVGLSGQNEILASASSENDKPILSVRTKTEAHSPKHQNKTAPRGNHYFWPKSVTYLYLRDKPLVDVVKDFCKMQDVDVVISSQLNQSKVRVHRSFEKEYPSEIWNQLAKAYGLMWFFDGFVLYVYETGEIESKILKIHPQQIPPLLKTIEDLHFAGSNMGINPMKEGGILVVNGAPKMIELLESITSNMEFYRNVDVDTLEVKVFPLKHAWVDDKTIGQLAIPGVATLLNNILGQKTEDMSILNLNSSSAQKIESLKEKEQNKDKDKESKTGKDSEEETSKKPKTEGLPEGGYITTDPRQNAIIVKDFKNKMHMYETLIAKLDTPLELIEIQAAIVNVNKACGLTMGANTLSFGFKKIKEIKIQPLGNKVADTNTFSGSLSGIVNGNEFLTTINFLESKNLSKMLARPSVITMNNMAAIMNHGATYYLPIQGHKGGDLYSIQGNTELQVTPHIIHLNDSTQIQLLLSIKDDTISPGQGKDDKSKVDTSSISTQAVVVEGQSVLIGGYFHEAYAKDNSGFPILQDIPVLGHLFKNSSRNSAVSERLFLITPKIIEVSSTDKYEGLFQTPSQLLTPAERIDNGSVRDMLEKTIDQELMAEEMQAMEEEEANDEPIGEAEDVEDEQLAQVKAYVDDRLEALQNRPLQFQWDDNDNAQLNQIKSYVNDRFESLKRELYEGEEIDELAEPEYDKIIGEIPEDPPLSRLRP